MTETGLDSPVWVPLWAAIVIALPGTITAVTSAINMMHLSRMKDKMQTLEENTNSKMDKLLAAKDELRASTNTAARAEGKLEGAASVTTPAP